MEILGTILGFFVFIAHFLLPFKNNFINNFYIYLFFIGLIFLFILVYKLLKNKQFNYDILFLFMTLWISNFFGFLYLNFFNSHNISVFCYLVSIFSVLFLMKEIKKINKHYLKYLFILLFSFIYLLISFIKFI